MDIDFQEDLRKFNSDHAKLLYMIYFFYKNKKINSNQKKKLKSLIISDNDDLFNLLDQFEQTLNENTLLMEFLRVLEEDSELVQPLERGKDDSSPSRIQKRNFFNKNSYESSLKILGSKDKGSKIQAEKSFLNKTTVSLDSSVKKKIARLNDFRVDQFSVVDINPRIRFSSKNKKHGKNITPVISENKENLNIILINNTGLYEYSPLNRAYHSISSKAKTM